MKVRTEQVGREGWRENEGKKESVESESVPVTGATVPVHTSTLPPRRHRGGVGGVHTHTRTHMHALHTETHSSLTLLTLYQNCRSEAGWQEEGNTHTHKSKLKDKTTAPADLLCCFAFSFP